MSAIRQQIVAALETLCGTITTANSYLTNLGADVKVNPDADWEPISQDYPSGISLLETNATHQPGMVGEDFATLELEARIHSIAYAATNPDDTVRNGFVDLCEAILEDKTLGGLADDCMTTTAPLVEVQRGKRKAVLTVGLKIHFRTSRGAPATAPV